MVIPDRQTQNGTWLKSITTDKKQCYTRAGLTWWNIRSRCDPNSLKQKLAPRYAGCTMSEKFKDFQYFAEWCNAQVGYGLETYEIDKDLLNKGNKIYSEAKCVFVPHSLNCFLTATNAKRGVYPQGVSLHKRYGFQAQVLISGKHVTLGYRNTPEECAALYKEAKEAEAQRWVSRLKAGEFVVDERVIEALTNWHFEEDFDDCN